MKKLRHLGCLTKVTTSAYGTWRMEDLKCSELKSSELKKIILVGSL